MKYTFVVLVETFSCLIFLLPRFRILNSLKSQYLRLFFGAKIGKKVIYYPGVWIFTGRNLVVGDHVDFAKGVLITTDGGVEIGARTLVGYGTHIISRNHKVPKLPAPIFGAGHVGKKVTIGENVWIGANCTILPGAQIGDNAIVAAGSVVTKTVAPGDIVSGLPARKIRARI